MILIHSDVMIGRAGGLVTSTSTLASAQLHQTYQLTIKDRSTMVDRHHPSRKKLARNLLTILTAKECSCRASLVESKDAWWNPKKRRRNESVPGDEPDACQSCSPLDLKLQKKGKDSLMLQKESKQNPSSVISCL